MLIGQLDFFEAGLEILPALRAGEAKGDMVQANSVRRRGRGVLTLPSVEANVVMITARRNHTHAKALTDAHIVKTEQVVVIATGGFKVGNVQVEMAEAGFRRNVAFRGVAVAELGKEAVQIERFAAITGGTIGGLGDELAIFNRKNSVFGRFAI